METTRPPAQADPPEGKQWTRAILHVDMDAFYVNVHILDHPEDAAVPLVVGGRPDQRGVVASASYQARKLGIHSAMPTSTAVRLCPTLKIVSANWSRIRECSRQVIRILERFGPVEQISVDEAYVDLAACPVPEEAALQVRNAVKDETQLPCSIGLATSKLVAKVASDFGKPEGSTVVMPGGEARFLAPMSPRVLWGIGPRTSARLADMGITTCEHLADADESLLEIHFGRHGRSLKQRAQGEDGREIQTERGQARSISQEWTFNKDTRDKDLLRRHLGEMSDSVAGSLKKRGLVAYTVRVKIRLADFTTFTRQKSIEIGTDNADVIFRLAIALWSENWDPRQELRLIGVGVSNLEVPEGRQLDLGI